MSSGCPACPLPLTLTPYANPSVQTMKLPFIKPKFIKKKIRTPDGEHEIEIYSIRPRHVPVLAELTMPFAQGIALVLQPKDHDRASRSVDTYNAPADKLDVDGTFSNYVRETDAVSPEMAKVREEQIRNGLHQAIIGGLSGENLTKLTEVMLGCLGEFRNVKFRELRKHAEEFLDDSDLDMSVFQQLIEGMWEANKAEFGPFFARMLGGKTLSDLLSPVAASMTRASKKPSDDIESELDSNSNQENEAPSPSTMPTTGSMPTSTQQPSPSLQPSTSP